ncbi:MAG: SufD family Fe-S cluster assembly protein [Candidatus Atribacteria bacterium]|nr:SufD family Fe-S cluster assembly protein [Candidatus Atribacteria bacterium]
MSVNIKGEYEQIIDALEKNGSDTSQFFDKRVASIVISGNKVLGLNGINGVKLVPHEIKNGVRVDMEIEEGVAVPFPIHVCTGYVEKKGLQNVVFNITVRKHAKVKFLAHCVFPQAEEFTHNAVSNVVIEEGAIMEYADEHIHSDLGTITLRTTTNAKVGVSGIYKNAFTLTKTRVGKLMVEMNLDLGKKAVGELISKVKGTKKDEIEIKESLMLNGEHSRGIAKSTVVALDETKANIVNIAYGNAPYAVGHVECHEITKGNSVDVKTEPILKVINDLSELTHEASIGRINKRQLETFMAKGLTEDEATELIIKGLLQ